MEASWRTKRSYPSCSESLAAIVFATPVFPPEASAQTNGGRLEPGGVGGVVGGAAIRGADARVPPFAVGVTEPVGSSDGPHAIRIETNTRVNAVRTDQWYGRSPPEHWSGERRGGGTGRRVGLFSLTTPP